MPLEMCLCRTLSILLPLYLHPQTLPYHTKKTKAITWTTSLVTVTYIVYISIQHMNPAPHTNTCPPKTQHHLQWPPADFHRFYTAAEGNTTTTADFVAFFSPNATIAMGPVQNFTGADQIVTFKETICSGDCVVNYVCLALPPLVLMMTDVFAAALPECGDGECGDGHRQDLCGPGACESALCEWELRSHEVSSSFPGRCSGILVTDALRRC